MHLSISIPNSTKRSNSDDTRLLSIFSIVLLFTAFLHHAAVCFLVTHVITNASSLLILTELAMLSITSIFFIRNAEIGYLIILIFIFANAFILAIFQGGFDPKSVRNFMIPILMVWLGSRYDNQMPVDTVVKYLAWIFLLFGLFEFLFPDPFQQVFNVLKFQISTGRSTEAATEFVEGSFSLNGTRWGGRNLLPFLGDHRVSSIFLETVNTSNFCTLLAAWGLSKKSIKEGWQFYSVAIIMAVLADSRFGFTLIILMTMLRFLLSINLLKFVAYFSPVLVLFVCIFFGWNYEGFRDDFETRLGSTGFYILHFNPLEFFGLYNTHYLKFVDQGYAKLLHYDGIMIMIVLWVSFCRLRVSDDGLIYKCLVAIIIASNLAVSGDSMFSFKWVTILWFLLGTTLLHQQAMAYKNI